MGPPRPPQPHVPGIYRYTATALGAGMWFWVCIFPPILGPERYRWALQAHVSG